MLKPLIIAMCFFSLIGILGLFGIFYEKTWMVHNHWVAPIIAFGLGVAVLLVMVGLSKTLQEIFGPSVKKVGWIFSCLWVVGLWVTHSFVKDPTQQAPINHTFFEAYIIFWFLIYLAAAWDRRGQNRRRVK